MTLREVLALVEKKHGKDSRVAQFIRNQIMAEEAGQSFQELYVTGVVK